MAWADTATAILQLRDLINDGPKDKRCSNKKVLGPVNGVNLNFQTFEFRRVVTFTSATFPYGVFKNGVPITPVFDDFQDTGSFTIAIGDVPSNRDVITATYFYQWFLDSELDSFLQNASTWLQYGTTYINLTDSLNAAALRFAAQEAYEKAAAKYTVRMSETYQLEDAPSENILKAVDAFRSMADGFLAKAEKMRDDNYTRAGQALAPNFSFQTGTVIDPTPRR